MMTEPRPADDVLLSVDRDGPERFRIRSDHLEDIGKKLRGRPKFSVFNSIILPLCVTLVTLLVTALFQFVSWTNEVRLDEAKAVVERAEKSSAAVTALTSERHYSTFVFIAALKELVAAPDPETAGATPAAVSEGTTGIGGAFPSELSPGIPSSAPIADRKPPSLARLDMRLNEQRHRGYYEQLLKWNATINQSLADLDYALDRPIFQQAYGASLEAHRSVADYYQKLRKIDCEAPLPDEIAKLQANSEADQLRNNLELRLAGINICFMGINRKLNDIKRGKPAAANWGEQVEKDLADIQTMASELRCRALHRVDFYNRQKDGAIISIGWLLRRLTNGDQQEARRHFDETEKTCDRSSGGAKAKRSS